MFKPRIDYFHRIESMRTYLLLVIFLSIGLIECQAQKKHSFFINGGFAYNDSLQLNEVDVENSNGIVLELGLNYRILNTSVFFTEIGFSTKSIFAAGSIKGQKFNASTLRLSMPFNIVFPFMNDKLLISNGVRIQNNVDASEFDIRLRDKYSWRLDYVIELRLLLINNYYLTAGFTSNLRDIPDPYFVNDPRKSFYLGINKLLSFSKNRTPKS